MSWPNVEYEKTSYSVIRIRDIGNLVLKDDFPSADAAVSWVKQGWEEARNRRDLYLEKLGSNIKDHLPAARDLSGQELEEFTKAALERWNYQVEYDFVIYQEFQSRKKIMYATAQEIVDSN